MLPDKIAQQLLVHTRLVRDCGVPKRAAEFDGFEKDGLGLFGSQVGAEAEGEAHGAEAGGGDGGGLEGEGFDHVGGWSCS